MAVHYSETEYAFVSAKVRSLESGLVSRAQLERMLASESSDEAFAVLRENGFSQKGRVTAASCEDTLLAALKAGLDAVKSGLPHPGVMKVFEYPYDCNNIKAAIKCGFRGIDPTPMLFDTGSVSASTVVEACEKRDFSALPENMAKAAAEAIYAFKKTGNPQSIDFILDRACFLDIAACAKEYRIPYITKYCTASADLTDFMICLRVLRMRCGAYGDTLVPAALVDGGSIGREEFRKAFRAGEEELFALIGKKYPYITENCRPGCDLEIIERTCDNCRLRFSEAGKHVTMGIEVPVSYILALENEIKNVRIILAGKDAALPEDRIRERLRDCYV